MSYYPIWPIETREGAYEPTPQTINYGSDAPHHAQNLGVDIHAVMHDYWIAIAHKGAENVHIIGAWESLGDCGVACELQWDWQGTRYNLRYCHGHEHYESRWGATWENWRQYNEMPIGTRIGEVGMTGKTGGPHLHLAAAVGCAPGGLLESGQRYRADVLLAEIVASYEQEEEPVPEGYVLIKREDLQNLRDVTNGWGQAAATDTGPYRLTVARNRRKCSLELLDVAKAAEEALAQ